MDAAYLREILDYDHLTGNFTRRRNGKRAGCKITIGYILISVNKRAYYAHRLAWLYVNSKWPSHEIDHINGDRADNRIANLREATHIQNTANYGARSDNKSGLRGVYYNKLRKTWHAQIRWCDWKLHLGTFDTPEAAREAYREVAEKLHREFVN